MDSSKYTKEYIEVALNDIFNTLGKREIKMYTGIGGMDNHQEAMENYTGHERLYIGKKVPRILRRLKMNIRKSIRDRYYKLVKISNGRK